MNKRVKAHRFGFKEALRHMKRYLDQRGAGAMGRTFKYLDALGHACWMDFYGVARANTLIIGPDRTLNLILALRCAARGQKVFVHEGDQQQWQGYQAVLDRRTACWHPSFTGLVESALAIRLEGMNVASELALQCAQYIDPNAEPLILSPNRISLFSDKLTHTKKRFRFWVEPGHSSAVPGLYPLNFWLQSSANIYDTEEGKADRFALEVDTVILTGVPGPSMGDAIEDSVRVGEAQRPIGGFSVFRTKDRLQDVAESLGVDVS